jgi:hypothetical protein
MDEQPVNQRPVMRANYGFWLWAVFLAGLLLILIISWRFFWG